MHVAKGVFVGLAIFIVSWMSYLLIAVITGFYFRGTTHSQYFWVALLAFIAIGIWLARKQLVTAALMRLLTSAFIGFGFVALVHLAGILSLRTGKVNQWFIAESNLVFWPDRYLVLGRLDCPNADSISDKMTCAALSVGISCLGYSALTYFLLLLVKKWRVSRASNPVVPG